MGKEQKDTVIYIAYDDFEAFDSARPEKNLLLAILLTAMNDLKKNGQAARKALEYLLNPDEEYIFSFRSVCEHLDIDAERVLRCTGLTPGQPVMEPARFENEADRLN